MNTFINLLTLYDPKSQNALTADQKLFSAFYLADNKDYESVNNSINKKICTGFPATSFNCRWNKHV